MSNTRTISPRKISTLNDAQAAFDDLIQAFNNLAIHFYWGTGSPEGAVTAPVGSIYLRNDGGAATSAYVKESGTANTGWVGK